MTICILFAFSMVRYTSYHGFAIPTDSAENVANAFFVSQGWRAFSDFGNNHFPGVYLYIAPFLKLLGFRTGFQGPEFLEAVTLAGSFATVLFQVPLFALAMRLSGLRALFTTCAIAVLAIPLYAAWNVHLPMSETYCVGLFALWTVLVHRAVLGPTARARFLAAFWLVPIGAVSTWFGLTQAFANALGALFGAGAMWAARGGMAADPLVRRHLAAGLALCLALLAATLWLVDASALVLYAVEINLQLIRPVVAGQLASIGEWHFGRPADVPLLKSLPFLLLLVGANSWLLCRRGADRRRIAVFGAVVAAGAVLTFWRDTRWFHAAPILGIQLGLMFLLAGALRRVARPWHMGAGLARVRREARYLVLGMMLLASALFPSNLRTLLARTEPPSVRPAAFEGVCRFGEAAGCACVRVSQFDPAFFLSHDLRPCRGYGFWTPLLRAYAPLWNEYLREVQSRRIAYAIFEPLRPDVSFGESLARDIERSYTCRQVLREPGIGSEFRLCVPPE